MNQDISCLVVSFLDITEYLPETRKFLFDSIGVIDSEKAESIWWRCSNCYYEKCANTMIHIVNGKIHSEKGPAKVSCSGEKKEWFVNNRIHRTDGPAIEWPNGDKQWFVGGKLHRTDGPASEYNDGSSEWWLHGKLHRTDGPALYWKNIITSWYINGKLHRTDGPAIEMANGHKEWYLDGKLHKNSPSHLEN